MSFIIRPATTEDLAELVRLRQERMEVYLKAEPRLQHANDTSVWQAAIGAWLADERAAVHVAARQDELIGYMVGWQWDNPPWVEPSKIGMITEMSVDGHCKQGGVGSALLASLRTWFATQGVYAVEIRVARQHPIEQAFWRATGAQPFLDHFYYQWES